MVTDEEIKTQIFTIVATHARREETSLTLTTTIDDLRMGSLDIVQMLFGIEDTFDVYVPTEHLQLRSATLGELCDRVKKLIDDRHV